jgi:hypothetical protein
MAALVGTFATLCGLSMVAEPSLAAAGATARAPSDAAVPRFELEYRATGLERGKKAIEDAIEQAVREMNPLVRGIARRRLLESNEVIPELAFHLSTDTLITSYVGGAIAEAPANGRPVPWIDQFGQQVQITHQLRGRTLHQTMSGAEGDRRNQYRFSADEKTMIMSVEIRSERLPCPVRYEVRYRRAE